MAERPHREPRVPTPPRHEPIEGGEIEGGDIVGIPEPAQKGAGGARREHAVEEREGDGAARREHVGPLGQEYPSKPVPHRQRVAERLAYALLALLGGTIFIHYVLSFFLIMRYRENYEPVAREFDKIFNNLLPILSGLAGSAVTYYFTRDTRTT